MTKHNKKRNVGIVYEMLANYVSNAIIEDRQSDAKKAIKIIERRFDKKTHLFKEFRLFKALANVTISDTHIAAGILHEAKLAARSFDKKALDREKSLLIKDINYQLSDSNFFHTRVDEYKVYATIQTLLNEWRKSTNADITKVVNYERLIIEHLLKDKNQNLDEGSNPENKIESDLLIFKLLSEKMNKKYNQSLSNEQKSIIRNYAIYADDKDALRHFLNSIKDKTLSQLSEFKKKTSNKILLEKVDSVHTAIKNLQTENVNDDVVKRYLTISSLKQELLGAINE